jgi:hypothetical protein
MSVEAPPLLEIDGAEFAEAFARRPLPVRHHLAGHPLLTLESIAKLADSLPSNCVERHQADLPVLMPGGAPELEGPPSETVMEIQTNGAWMVLWYIERRSEYSQLLDDCLAAAAPHVADRDGGMSPRRREAFLFLSAPGATTPVHFDPEHNFLLQIKGTKDMNVCRFESVEVERKELERYYGGGHRNLEEMPGGEETFRMHPDDGVYVPSFAPHWVQNGGEASVSLSITFRSRGSERRERVYEFNSRLRRIGISPKPFGASERSDRAKELAFVATAGWKSRLSRAGRLAMRGRRSAQAV